MGNFSFFFLIHLHFEKSAQKKSDQKLILQIWIHVPSLCWFADKKPNVEYPFFLHPGDENGFTRSLNMWKKNFFSHVCLKNTSLSSLTRISHVIIRNYYARHRRYHWKARSLISVTYKTEILSFMTTSSVPPGQTFWNSQMSHNLQIKTEFVVFTTTFAYNTTEKWNFDVKRLTSQNGIR